MRNKRKGIAVITVILISAIIFASIAGIVAKMVPENKIINSSSTSKLALSAAETGLSRAIFNLRNADFKSGTTAPSGDLVYLSFSDIKSIANASTSPPDNILTFSEQPLSGSTTPYVAFQVKMKKIQEIAGTKPGEEKDIVKIYSMGTVYQDSSKTKVLARKIISAIYVISFAQSTVQSFVVDFGILAGGNIDFRGNSSENGGDIFANGKITSEGNNLRVVGGEAYSSGGTIDKGVALKTFTGVAPVNIPKMFEGYTTDLASKFKTGQTPYDGTKTGFPNTNDPDVTNLISSYLPGTSNTLEQIHAFYTDLLDKKGGFSALYDQKPSAYSDLLINEKNIAYYVNGKVTLTNDLSFLKDDMKNFGFVRLGGTIFIDGDLTIAGNPVIGDVSKLDLKIIVNGKVYVKTTGNATFNGLIYAKQGVEFDVSGNFSLNGSLITEDDVTLKGNSSVNFKAMGLNQQPIEEYTMTVSANVNENSWKEVSYDVFLDPTKDS